MDLSMFSLVEIAVAMVFTGLVVVFVALVGLWVIVAACGWLFTLKKTEPSADTDKSVPTLKSAPTPKAPSSEPTPVVEQGISPAVVAAISGAVAAMTYGRGTVTSVALAQQSQTVNPALSQSRRSAWTKAGLRQNLQPF